MPRTPISTTPIARQFTSPSPRSTIATAASPPLPAAGFDIEKTIQIRQGRVEGQQKLTALLALCRQIADNRGWVDESARVAAINAGWTIDEILDAFSDVVRTILTNYFNHLVDTDLDLSEVPPLPTDARNQRVESSW